MLIILLTLFFYLRSAFDQNTKDNFKEQGESYANMIQTEFENPVSFLAGVCNTVEAQIETGHVDRIELQKLLFRTFEQYTISEGTAFMMEPNAYDGLDSEYIASQYGTKPSGRISYYYFRDPDGQTRYLPQTEEDDQEFVQPYYTTSKERKVATFSEPYLYTVDGRTGFMITASYPLINDAGEVIGIMTVDMYLNSINDVLKEEKIYDTGYIVVFSEEGKVLYSPNLDDVGKDSAEVGIDYARPEVGEAIVYSQVKSIVNGKKSLAATVPVQLKLADSKFYVSIVAPESEANAVYIRLLLLMLGITILVGIAIAIVINVSAGKITRPLKMIRRLLKQVGETGDLSFSDEEWAKIRAAAALEDEIGQSIAAFANMLKQFVYYDEVLQRVAARDLTVEVSTLSSEDTMGTALNTVVSNLNEMFAKIHFAASQVSIGSKQIAEGSHGLAHGANEQASAVAQLSETITTVSDSVISAAKSARNAANLADDIKNKAEQGSTRMDAMVESVREINEASHQISQVIKVIDDIAFQTNILALNAAVEAARAGQHGKGFAVVADEVRNLATRSANAAKDTQALIENSVTRADAGIQIAKETSDSLSEIVSGIVESSQISGEIATSADNQSTAIDQINSGVTHVSLVVQENSATSEESAAASAELRKQSETLDALIAQFKLK
jgi:methyl-accepting chemotaxis protein